MFGPDPFDQDMAHLFYLICFFGVCLVATLVLRFCFKDRD